MGEIDSPQKASSPRVKSPRRKQQQSKEMKLHSAIKAIKQTKSPIKPPNVNQSLPSDYKLILKTPSASEKAPLQAITSQINRESSQLVRDSNQFQTASFKSSGRLKTDMEGREDYLTAMGDRQEDGLGDVAEARQLQLSMHFDNGSASKYDATHFSSCQSMPQHGISLSNPDHESSNHCTEPYSNNGGASGHNARRASQRRRRGQRSSNKGSMAVTPTSLKNRRAPQNENQVEGLKRVREFK
jgi:hypothetical protein